MDHIMCCGAEQALGLGTVMVGAFSDRQMQTVLGIENPVWYVIPVGVPGR